MHEELVCIDSCILQGLFLMSMKNLNTLLITSISWSYQLCVQENFSLSFSLGLRKLHWIYLTALQKKERMVTLRSTTTLYTIIQIFDSSILNQTPFYSLFWNDQLYTVNYIKCINFRTKSDFIIESQMKQINILPFGSSLWSKKGTASQKKIQPLIT